MTTPASGAISMNDMRTHINRATTSSISMDEMRTRYGGSGAISFSDLYDSEGFTVTCSFYRSKFINFDGWSDFFAIGSVSPDEGDGRISFATNSWLATLQTATLATGNTTLQLYNSSTNATPTDAGMTTGYNASDVTRVVTANTSRTIQLQVANSTYNSVIVGYTTPNSGTIHCLVKF